MMSFIRQSSVWLVKFTDLTWKKHKGHTIWRVWGLYTTLNGAHKAIKEAGFDPESDEWDITEEEIAS